MASESTAISSARTTARSGSRRTSGDGRPGGPSELAALLDDETGGDEVADEPADAAAGQPGALAELRARQRPVGVQHLDERAEVGPPDRLAALPAVPRPVTRICAPRVEMFVTRLPRIRARCQGPPAPAADAVVQSASCGRLGYGTLIVGAGDRRAPPGVAALGRPGRPRTRRTSWPTAAGIDHRYEGDFQYFVGGGVAAFDCDDDGRSELYLAGGSAPAALYRNESPTGGALRFTPLASPVTDLTAVTGAYPLDVDSDGHIDLAVLRVGEDVVLRGLGDCRFERANEALGLDGGELVDRRLQRDVGGRRTTCPRWRSGTTSRPTARRARTAGCCDRRRTATVRRADRPVARLLHAVDAVQRLEPLRPARPAHDQRPPLLPGRQRTSCGGSRPVRRRGSYTEADGWRPLQIWGMGIASEDLTGDGRPEVFLTSQGDNKLQTLADGRDPPDVRGHRPRARRHGAPPVHRRRRAAVDRLARRVRRRQQRRLRRPVRRQGQRRGRGGLRHPRSEQPA